MVFLNTNQQDFAIIEFLFSLKKILIFYLFLDCYLNNYLNNILSIKLLYKFKIVVIVIITNIVAVIIILIYIITLFKLYDSLLFITIYQLFWINYIFESFLYILRYKQNDFVIKNIIEFITMIENSVVVFFDQYYYFIFR